MGIDQRAFLHDAMQPFSPRNRNCVTAVRSALRAYPKAQDAFNAWLARGARRCARDVCGARTAALAKHVATTDQTPKEGVAPAWGVARIGEIEVCAVRSGGVWLCRASPRGVIRIDAERIVAAWGVE